MENTTTKTEKEKFSDMLAESFEKIDTLEGSVVSGEVVGIENDFALIDVGLKSEGRVSLKEFAAHGQKAEIKNGDMVDVYIEKIEGRNGETVLSREKAKSEEAWVVLEKAHEKQERVNGVIFGKVKGGLTVDLDGAVAFLPGSQIDTRQILKDTKELLNKPIELMILKMDKYRGNIVVSRKAITENELKEQRSELLKNIKEGSIIEGIQLLIRSTVA